MKDIIDLVLTIPHETVRDIYDVDEGIALNVEVDENSNSQTKLVFEQLEAGQTYALHIHKLLIPRIGGIILQQTEICMSDVQVQTFILLLANLIDCDVKLVKQK